VRRQVFGSNRSEEQDRLFVEYVAARRAKLYRTAYLVCGDAHAAEDLVQISLVKAYVAWPRLHRAGNVDAYVRRILVNAHVDETRRTWRRERPGLDEIDQATPAPAHDAHEDLWAALRGLAPGQRRIVVLRHYWGLSVEETAADLGISPGTVKSQTSDALAHLRRALSDAETGADHDRAR
jgi:RNA polymerase sigma-70 factor (sigma-E family)